jgi:hypothetical protein
LNPRHRYLGFKVRHATNAPPTHSNLMIYEYLMHLIIGLIYNFDLDGKLNLQDEINPYTLLTLNPCWKKYFFRIVVPEIKSLVSYLGRRGVFSVSEGLKVAYVSGTEGEKDSATRFTAADVVRVRDSCVKGQPSYRGVDVLLTSQWPQGVTQRDDKTVSTPPTRGGPADSSVSQIFWQRTYHSIIFHIN